MRVYEIHKEIESIWSEVEASGGEITEEQQQRLHDLDLTFDAKIEHVCKLIRNREWELKSVQGEIGALQDRKRIVDNDIHRLKAFVGQWIGEGNNLTFGAFPIRWKKSESVEIVDESLIPDWFMREEIKRSPNKVDILKYSKEQGENVPGTEIKKSMSLVIGLSKKHTEEETP